MTVTLILLDVAVVVLIWAYKITRKPRSNWRIGTGSCTFPRSAWERV